MALISCPECGAHISNKADVCIKCGFPLGSHKDPEGSQAIAACKPKVLLKGNPHYDSEEMDSISTGLSSNIPDHDALFVSRDRAPKRSNGDGLVGFISVGLGIASILTPYFAAVFFVPAAIICGLVAFHRGQKTWGGIGTILGIVGLVGVISISHRITEAQQNLDRSSKELEQSLQRLQ